MSAAARNTQKKPKSVQRPAEVRTPSGASAAVFGDALVVRDIAGAIVAVHDAATGETRIVASGDLVMQAGGRVVIAAGTDVDISARGTTNIASPVLSATVDRASLHGREASVNVDRLVIAAQEISTLAGRFELRARRVIEQLGDVYRDVEGVDQTRAGRVRTLVAGVYRVFAQRSEVVSRDDSIIDGKRVLLG